MNQPIIISRLPVEITREIFKCIINQHTTNCRATKTEGCKCWQLDLMSTAMVCKSWYFICLELMKYRWWLPLLNHANFQRTYPYRAKLVHLLRESHLTHLVFHQQVKHLVIDFASFDTIRREKLKNIVVKKKVHHPYALRNTLELIKLCTNIEKLDIVFDAGYTTLLNASHDSLDQNCILSTCHLLRKALVENNIAKKIKHLQLTGYNPMQRCPCCAGKGWDQYLYPVLGCLTSLETLVLKNVLPSMQVFHELSKIPSLKKIVFYKSMVTIPSRRNDMITTVNQVPVKLWNQIRSIEIYEDIEDVTTWKSKRYLSQLIEQVVELESFVLHFDTKEEIERCLKEGILDGRKDKLWIEQDNNSLLHHLKEKCKHSLKQILLVNIPRI